MSACNRSVPLSGTRSSRTRSVAAIANTPSLNASSRLVRTATVCGTHRAASDLVTTVRLDMHMHSEYSRDSRVGLADFAELAKTAGLGAVCITDHDTIEGALRLREMDTGLQVIVGEEITRADGELVGLFRTDV